MTKASSSVLGRQDHKLFWRMGEHLYAVFGDDDIVFDPNASKSLDVNTGLDGPDLARFEHVVARNPHASAVVHGAAQTVAEPVAEILGKVFFAEDAASDAVDIFGRHSGLHGID